MTTLVTGATGFVGSHVARQLVDRGDHVRVLARRTSHLHAVEGLPVEVVFGDLRDRESLNPAVRGVQRVFHVAADYRLGSSEPSALYDSNVAGTKNLIDACRRVELERFIYTSTVGTIAVPRSGALPTEDTEARLDEMTGAYKRSKFLAEQEVRAAAASGLPAVIVNPTTPIGPGDWKPTPTGRMILDFLRGRMLAYVETGLNLVPVEDVAAGHLVAADRGRIGERYLLGGPNVSLKELWGVLARLTGRRAPSLRIPHALALAVGCGSQLVARARGTEPVVPLEAVRMARHVMFVDVSKARRELGFESGAIEAALDRAVGWYMERGYVKRSTGRGRFVA
ncbi:MAG TPA: hopanoid-associated sugar epimerase [Vicinamibacterales bacterium]|nr:hopanoid-associated sugar epimerase [Vicinamibacterales bacterium]